MSIVVHPEKEWVKRAYVPEDEDGIVYLFMRAYARSLYGQARGAHHRRSAEARAYWEEHRPVVEWLLANADIDVVCDPERVHHEPGRPAVIWGFCITSGDVVHMVVVKWSAIEAGLGPELFRDLVGDRVERACAVTHEIPQLRTREFGVAMPWRWVTDTTWFARRLLAPESSERLPEVA